MFDVFVKEILLPKELEFLDPSERELKKYI